MILFCNFSVPDHDQGDLAVQIPQNIQSFRQGLSFGLDQILAAVFLTAIYPPPDNLGIHGCPKRCSHCLLFFNRILYYIRTDTKNI